MHSSRERRPQRTEAGAGAGAEADRLGGVDRVVASSTGFQVCIGVAWAVAVGSVLAAVLSI